MSEYTLRWKRPWRVTAVGLRRLNSLPRLVRERDKIDLALKDEDWLGQVVFIYASGSWTIIEDVSGGLDMRTITDWLKLAENDELVYVSCNDAIAYAQLVVIENGQVRRHCLQSEDDPGANVNVGRIPEESEQPFADWIDVMRWIEDDEEKPERTEQGWLWIHQAT